MSINSDSFAPAPTRSVPSAWADGFRKSLCVRTIPLYPTSSRSWYWPAGASV